MAALNFTIRLTDEEREWVQKEAEAQQRSVANFIRYVLSLYRRNQNITS